MRGDHSGRTPIYRLSPGGHGLTRGIWPALVFTAIAQAASAAGPGVLTERRAIELALSRPAYLDLEQGRIATAKSSVATAGTWPNPTLGWDRNRVGSPAGDSTETSVVLSQTFDISGRRSLRREAAENRLDAARFDQQDRRAALIAEVRRQFGEALHQQRVRAALEDWQRRIESAAATIARLAKSGEASGYDRRRLEREAQTARARSSGTAADFARRSEILAGVTGERSAPLAGDLLPGPVPPLQTLQARLEQRPDLASLNAQATAYERERGAASRGWIPDITVGIGQKRVEDPGRSDQGPIVGIAVPIPLFDRGQGARQQADAQYSTLRADHALLRMKYQAELQGIWRQALELRSTAEAFRRESLNGSRELSRIAEAAYRAGEGNVLELLDAYRAELDTELTALELESRARMARIELDLLSGESQHEK